MKTSTQYFPVVLFVTIHKVFPIYQAILSVVLLSDSNF